MFEKIIISNFRCFEDFSIDFSEMNSCVLLGRNGSGKSTIAAAIEILQKMSRQTTRVKDLFKKDDFHSVKNNKSKFELWAKIDGKLFRYSICFELPERFHELRVLGESLLVDGKVIFERELAQVTLRRHGKSEEVSFGMDWHLAALPIIQTASSTDPISVFMKWLSRVIVLRPIPAIMRGDSDTQTLFPKSTAENYGEWFTGLIVDNPSAYTPFVDFLKSVMPDIATVKQRNIGDDSRTLVVDFINEDGGVNVPFTRLSDGEKCFFICALIIASTSVWTDVTCFWDEPENYLAPQEVSATIMSLRRAFKGNSQFIMTSHNPAAIRSFSHENTIVLSRSSHLATPIAKSMVDLNKENEFGGNTLDLWLTGDLEA